MQRLFQNLDLYNRTVQYIAGCILAFFGYFLPIYDMGKFVILLFIADFLIGVWHSKKNKKQKFSGKLFWSTVVPRMALSIFLIMVLYQWDETYKQEFVSTYKVVAWFISGALIWSIADNAYKITNWGVFMSIGKFLKKKIEDETGQEVDKKELLKVMKEKEGEEK